MGDCQLEPGGSPGSFLLCNVQRSRGTVIKGVLRSDRLFFEPRTPRPARKEGQVTFLMAVRGRLWQRVLTCVPRCCTGPTGVYRIANRFSPPAANPHTAALHTASGRLFAVVMTPK